MSLNLDPQALVARSLALYSTCETYQDEGFVEYAVEDQLYFVPFRTAFERCGYYRFDCNLKSFSSRFLEKNQTTLIWNGERALYNDRRVSTLEIQPKSLQDVISSAACLSKYAAQLVAPLLIDLVDQKYLSKFAGSEKFVLEKCCGVESHRLQVMEDDNIFTAWLAKDSGAMLGVRMDIHSSADSKRDRMAKTCELISSIGYDISYMTTLMKFEDERLVRSFWYTKVDLGAPIPKSKFMVL